MKWGVLYKKQLIDNEGSEQSYYQQIPEHIGQMEFPLLTQGMPNTCHRVIQVIS